MMRFLVLIALLALVSPAFADDASDYRTVSVSADGEVKSAPDKVDVMLGISERAKKLSDAKKATDDQLKSLFEIAKQMGIAEKDMQTTYSAVQPEYRWDEPSNKNVMDGYRVTHNVTVTLRKLDDLGAFTDAVLAAKIDEINGVNYGIENMDALKESALKLAVGKAKRKADVLAGAAGAKIGRVISIQESGAMQPPLPPRPMMMKSAMAMEAADARSPTPPPGELTVHVDVSISYELQ